ncbi:hypothetical protein BDZ90DRAFT_278061 [Jaminaea rosea]|uniref:Uncharacterized protein n=1 Tax=Jaminaea rosea TaxID=1569628 RepID=A0A316UZS7_9BASI|nr:hypothetical protein BDZ90DRAFT_278061 [Jaminaea rosea]PWN29811.1 hypothetical protein BDZ90DRAFT_278061 [Jaminaea rosea]
MPQSPFFAYQVTLTIALDPDNHTSIFSRVGLPPSSADSAPVTLFHIPTEIFDSPSQTRWLSSTAEERAAHIRLQQSRMPQHKKEVAAHVAMSLSLGRMVGTLATALGLPYGWELRVQGGRKVVECGTAEDNGGLHDMTLAEFLCRPATSRGRTTVAATIRWPNIDVSGAVYTSNMGDRNSAFMFSTLLLGLSSAHAAQTDDKKHSYEQLCPPKCSITGAEIDNSGAYLLPREMADWRITWTLRGLQEALHPFEGELPRKLEDALGCCRGAGIVAASRSKGANLEPQPEAYCLKLMSRARRNFRTRLPLAPELARAVQLQYLWLLPHAEQAHWIESRPMPSSLEEATTNSSGKGRSLATDLSHTARLPALIVAAARFAYERFATGALQDIFKARALLMAEEVERQQSSEAGMEIEGQLKGLGIDVDPSSAVAGDFVHFKRPSGSEKTSPATSVIPFPTIQRSDHHAEIRDEHLLDDVHGIHDEYHDEIQGAADYGAMDTDETGVDAHETALRRISALSHAFDALWTNGSAIELNRTLTPSKEERKQRHFVSLASRLAIWYARLSARCVLTHDAGMRCLVDQFVGLERLAAAVHRSEPEVIRRRSPRLTESAPHRNEEAQLFLRCLEQAGVDFEELDAYFSGGASGRWDVSSRTVGVQIKKQQGAVFYAVWPLVAAGEMDGVPKRRR